jgi:hypothetical protein
MITSGSILIGKDTLRPQCFRIQDESHPNAWMSVQHGLTSSELETELGATGWTFFYLANAIKAVAFGGNRAKMLHAALKRLIEKARLQGCNCLEIDYINMHSFLWLPFVSVSAHPRHIQMGNVFVPQYVDSRAER